MKERVLYHTVDNLHLIDATIDESDSYSFLQYYYQENYNYYRYSYPDIYSFEEIRNMSNNFCIFHARIKDLHGVVLSSPIPIETFRFVMLEDLSFSSYYAVHKKPGYVVEGFYWSNGMLYQVREDKDSDFDIYQIVLFVDPYTKNLYQYP